MQIERAVLRRLPQRLEDRGVVHHQHIGIRHEQLEAGHALAHHVVHVFQARISKVRHNHVQPVVDACLALGLLPPGIERRAHLRALRLDGEVHNRRRSANRRGPRARFKIVRRRSSRRTAYRDACARRCRPAAPAAPSHPPPLSAALAGIPARTSLITAPSISKSAFTLPSAFTIVPF